MARLSCSAQDLRGCGLYDKLTGGAVNGANAVQGG